MKTAAVILLALFLIGCAGGGGGYQSVAPYYGGGGFDDHMIMYPDLNQQPGFFFGDGQGGGTFYPHGISEPPIQIY